MEFYKMYQDLVLNIKHSGIQSNMLRLKDPIMIYDYLQEIKLTDSYNFTHDIWLLLAEYALISDEFPVTHPIFEVMLRRKSLGLSESVLKLRIFQYLNYSKEHINAYLNRIITSITEATEENAMIMRVLLIFFPDNIKLLIKVSMYTYFMYGNLEDACMILDDSLGLETSYNKFYHIDILTAYSRILEHQIKQINDDIKSHSTIECDEEMDESEKIDKLEAMSGHSFHLDVIYNKIITIAKTFDDLKILKLILKKKSNNMKIHLDNVAFKMAMKNEMIINSTTVLRDTMTLLYCDCIVYCNSDLNISNKLHIRRLLNSVNVAELTETEAKDFKQFLKLVKLR